MDVLAKTHWGWTSSFKYKHLITYIFFHVTLMIIQSYKI